MIVYYNFFRLKYIIIPIYKQSHLEISEGNDLFKLLNNKSL